MPQVFDVVPRGPFSLALARDAFGGWPAVETPSGQGLVAVFPVEGWKGSAAVVVQQVGPKVRGEVWGPSSRVNVDGAWSQVLAALSLDGDGTGFPEVGARDPVVDKIQRHFDYGRPICNFSPWEAAVRRVLSHRQSMAQARRISQNLARQVGDEVRVDIGGKPTTWRAFPRPQRVLELDAFPGISAPKLVSLKAIAEAALQGRMDRQRLRSLPLEQAVADMAEIPGIGEWTSQGVVLRGAGIVDALPDDDATRQSVRFAYGLPKLPTQKEVEARAEAWKPFRMWTVVLLHLWFRRTGPGPGRPRRPREGR